MKIALTGREVVAGLELPAGARELTFFDHGHPDCVVGFGLRVRASGVRTWVLQYKYGKKHQRMKLGTWPALSLEKARAKARQYREDIGGGGDPASIRIENRRRSTETFGRIVTRFLALRKESMRPRSYAETERHLNTHAKPLHDLLLAGIDRRRVAALLSEVAQASGRIAANRVRASLSAFFTWAVREGMIDVNIVLATNRFEELARDRVLSLGELCDIWVALLGDHYGAIVKLLILTGQRRDEIGGLRWSEIDFERNAILLPARAQKTSASTKSLCRRRCGSSWNPAIIKTAATSSSGTAKDSSAVGRMGKRRLTRDYCELGAHH